jgi:hypothetical protein
MKMEEQNRFTDKKVLLKSIDSTIESLKKLWELIGFSKGSKESVVILKELEDFECNLKNYKNKVVSDNY